MSHIRLFLVCGEAVARASARILEIAFEEDALPVAAFEVDEAKGVWSVSVYAMNLQAGEIEKRMLAALQQANLPHAIDREPLGEIDWVAATLAALSPVRSGRFVVHGSHDRHVPRAHEIAIEIDAGQAFGTGHHATTAGCLDMLGRCLKRRRYRNCLDLGTGSGVLAIAAAKAQPMAVLASDIDPVAVSVARSNVRLNHMAAKVKCAAASGFNHRAFREAGLFDLVLANILARPLETLAPALVDYLAANATVILSGLLMHQHARIVAAYRAQGLCLVKAHHRDGWLTLVMEKTQATSLDRTPVPKRFFNRASVP